MLKMMIRGEDWIMWLMMFTLAIWRYIYYIMPGCNVHSMYVLMYYTCYVHMIH